MSIDEKFVTGLLSNTTSLMNHVYWFEQTFSHPPGKSHRCTTVNHVDIQERVDDFIRELRATACAWVYSKDKYKKIFESELIKRGGDIQNVAAHIEEIAREKFRRGHPQGQFGELLLFNFIQYFFKAAPLLRKMPLTTSASLERFGADAIHFKREAEKNKIILGESKTYKSVYKFNAAFEDALESIVKTYQNLQKELLLYVYDDFLDEKLKAVGEAFKEGTLKDVEIELVCLVSYQENINVKGVDESEIKDKIRLVIEKRFQEVDKKKCSAIDKYLIKKINYIVFPFWDLEGVLKGCEA